MLPQPLQFEGSNEVFVHMPPHTICDAEQLAWQTPDMQDWPAPHALPHVPQLAVSVAVLAQ